jgi:anti-sigma factor (TIGR02949 family)
MKTEINCIEALRQMYEAVDNHLPASSIPQAEAHLQDCPNCQKLLKVDRSVRERVRKTATAEFVPAGLRIRITRQIQDLESLSWKEKLFWLLPGRPWGWLGSAGVMIIVLLAIGIWTLWPVHSSFVSWCFEEHAEYIEGGFTLDITSSNPDAVDNWFEENVGVSPQIARFQRAGLTLVGGKKMEFGHSHSALGCLKKDEVWVSLYAALSLEVEIAGLTEQRLGEKRIWVGTARNSTQIVWKENRSGVTYSLVAELPLEELTQILAKI